MVGHVWLPSPNNILNIAMSAPLALRRLLRFGAGGHGKVPQACGNDSSVD